MPTANPAPPFFAITSAPDPFVVEIGSNDGITLQHFQRAGIRHLGVEPSANVAAVSAQRGIQTLVRFFDEDTARDIVAAHGQADVFFGANVMCHIPYIHSVLEGIDVLLAALAHGLSREEVLSPAWPVLDRLGPLHPSVEAVARGSFRASAPPGIRGSGYVAESLEAALWAFHDAPDFREAVLRAVNLGDDADTTGAVCGQLAGACWGESGIPLEWREGLARRDLIESFLQGIAAGPVQESLA